MPAVSKAQRKLFALALAVKRGEVDASTVDQKIRDLAKKKESDLKDFAETPEETLPNKLEDSVDEAAYDDPIKKNAEKRYKGHKTISIVGIGKPFEQIKVIPKGKYKIVEGDMEGRYFSPRFNVTLLKPMKPFDLAVQLAQETGWISPWNYLEMRKDHNRELGKALTFPREKTLFDESVDEGMLDKLDKFIYKANSLIFPKMTAGKFFILFTGHGLDIRNQEVKDYVEKTLPTQKVKDEFYKMLAGKGIKESVDEGLSVVFEFPDEKSARQFDLDIENSAIGIGDQVGNRVTVTNVDTKWRSTIKKYMKKNGGKAVKESSKKHLEEAIAYAEAMRYAIEENNAMATPGSVGGMGAVSMPGNPGTQASFTAQETGSGDLAASSALTDDDDEWELKKLESDGKKIHKFLKYNAFVGESLNEASIPKTFDIIFDAIKKSKLNAKPRITFKAAKRIAVKAPILSSLQGIRDHLDKTLKGFTVTKISNGDNYPSQQSFNIIDKDRKIYSIAMDLNDPGSFDISYSELNESVNESFSVAVGSLLALGLLGLGQYAANNLGRWIDDYKDKKQALKEFNYLVKRYGHLFKNDQPLKRLVNNFKYWDDKVKLEIEEEKQKEKNDPFYKKDRLGFSNLAIIKMPSYEKRLSALEEVGEYIKSVVSAEYGEEELKNQGKKFLALRNALLNESESVNERKKVHWYEKDKTTGNPMLDKFVKGLGAGNVSASWSNITVNNGVLDHNRNASYSITWDPMGEQWMVSIPGEDGNYELKPAKDIKNQEDLYKFVTQFVNGISFSR